MAQVGWSAVEERRRERRDTDARCVKFQEDGDRRASPFLRIFDRFERALFG